MEKKLKTILIPLMISSQAMAETNLEGFNGCVGKDSLGREVKVESLVRNLENCSFAKVYLKENEEKFKENIEAQIADSLKASMSQDLEDIVIQGEFFNSLNINLTKNDGSDQVKNKCQLDKMTAIGNCKGKNQKDYDRRKKAIYQAFGANDANQFTDKIKNKFKMLAGLDEQNSCSLIQSNTEQVALYNASLTTVSLLSLKEMIESDSLNSESLKKFPLLFLMSKGDPKTFESFMNEIKELKNNGNNAEVAKNIREKITSFYTKNENAQSLKSTVAKSCEDFQKKIDAFVCADDLQYVTKETTNSKRMFEGFDMKESNGGRNRRVNFMEKDMAFMAFGKSCEVSNNEETLQRKNLDFFTGNSGLYHQGIREVLEDDTKATMAKEVENIARCKVDKLQNKNLCSGNGVISSVKLAEVYQCPNSSECTDTVEKTINYLNVCESRQAKILAKKTREEEKSKVDGSTEVASESKEIELDFFDNLLGEKKKQQLANTDIKKQEKPSDESLKLKQEKSEIETSTIKGVSIADGDDGVIKENINSTSGESDNLVRNLNVNPTHNTQDSSTLNRFAAEVAEMRKSQTISNTLTAKRPTKNDQNMARSETYVTKENAELRERIAKLEGMSVAQESLAQANKATPNAEQRIQALNRENEILRNRERDLALKNRKMAKEVRENTDFRSAVQRSNNEMSVNDESDVTTESRGQEASRQVANTTTKANGTQSVGSIKDPKTGKAVTLISNDSTLENKTKGTAKEQSSNEVLITAEDIIGLDQTKLDQLWKDKNEKLHLGVKNKNQTIDTVIVAMDQSKKPIIENFGSLSVEVQRSILDWKLIKDNKLIVRKNELDQMLKKIK